MSIPYSLKRTGTFTFMFYLEDAPVNWQIRLINLRLPGYYINHYRDVEYPLMTLKRPHLHVLIKSDKRYRPDEIRKIAEYVGGSKVKVQPVVSFKGILRYLCHLDDPNKAQYNMEEVQCMCGCNYQKEVGPGYENQAQIVSEIVEFCESEEIYVYADLVSYCVHNNERWLRFLIQRGKIIFDFMKSRCWDSNKR